jgi:alkanesulfonate monooxygenase
MTDRDSPVEVSWFSALCDDDYEFLGVAEERLRSSYEHCRDIVMAAERHGFDNILLPSGYQLGIDAIAFAGGIAPFVKRIRLLVAIRCGEMWPPQLARQLATLDRMLAGRLTINIISSDLPGQAVASGPRYRRCVEVMKILRTLLNGEALAFEGEFYQINLEPPAVRTVSQRCPLMYFGGLSEEAREAAAAGSDIYLMWPDTMANVKATMDDLVGRAARHRRKLRFGYRVHVVVRETESAARAAADRLLSRLDAEVGSQIRQKSLDHSSVGVHRQAELRESSSSDGYVEDDLWTGIGRARSGCGAAIVGDPDQVLSKLNRYRDLGIEVFILSGYPHETECDLFARYVLPRLNHRPLTIGRANLTPELS